MQHKKVGQKGNRPKIVAERDEDGKRVRARRGKKNDGGCRLACVFGVCVLIVNMG